MIPSTTVRSMDRLGARTWTTLVLVGLVGQLAWTVENMYLNLYVYKTITDDPTVIAVLVALSAISATLATLVVGAISDRLGRRRIFISAGYVLWGLSTAAFGLVSTDALGAVAPMMDLVTVTVLAIILLDCVMSVFGSGANDAAFGAWVTDVTAPTNRGRVDSVLATMPLVAMLIVFGALDGLTQAGQWREFFGVVGLFTMVMGVVSWFLIKDTSVGPSRSTGRFAELFDQLRPRAVKQNPGLYLAMLAWTIVGTASQVFIPYLIIYIQTFLGISGFAVVLATVLVSASIISILGGRLIDRWGKVRSIAPAGALFVLGLIGMFFARDMVAVILAGTVMMAGFMVSVAAISATARDYTPEHRAGSVQGVRMIFAIMIPMVVGPFIGAAAIVGANETYLDLGVEKQAPTPMIFLAAAIIMILLAYPVGRLLTLERGNRA